MITPNDIRNQSRKSGYDHVCPNRGSWRAQAYGAAGRVHSNGIQWWGPNRPTPLEAAQDYCDWYNAHKPLTIEDIRNPKRVSGFHWVTKTDAKTAHGHGGGKPFQARVTKKRPDGRPGSLDVWRGPRRTTAEEAAQDYCDRANGQRGTIPATRAKIVRVERAKLRFVKHPRKVRTRTGAVKTGESKPRREKEGPGYVYLLGMLGSPVEAVKIGESKDEGQYRLAGLQTGNPFELYVIGQIKTDKRLALEEELHLKFAKFHHQNPSLVGEWFVKDDSIVKHFKEVTTA